MRAGRSARIERQRRTLARIDERIADNQRYRAHARHKAETGLYDGEIARLTEQRANLTRNMEGR